MVLDLWIILLQWAAVVPAAFFWFEWTWNLSETTITCSRHFLLAIRAHEAKCSTAIYARFRFTIRLLFIEIESSRLARLDGRRFNCVFRRSVGHSILKRHLSKVWISCRSLLLIIQLFWMSLDLLLLVIVHRAEVVIRVKPMIRIRGIMLLPLSRVNILELLLLALSIDLTLLALLLIVRFAL